MRNFMHMKHIIKAAVHSTLQMLCSVKWTVAFDITYTKLVRPRIEYKISSMV